MTTQNILVLVGIVSVFATFGIVVAWADFYSRGCPKPDRQGTGRRPRMATKNSAKSGARRDTAPSRDLS